MYIPEDRDLQMEIICLHHDTPIPGHPGTEKTLELMQCSYTWSLEKDIRRLHHGSPGI